MLRDTIETLPLNEPILVIQKQSNQPLTLGHASLSLCCAAVVCWALEPCSPVLRPSLDISELWALDHTVWVFSLGKWG